MSESGAVSGPVPSVERVYWPAPRPPRPPMPPHYRAGFYWPAIFREHPALGVSLTYAILTLAGAGYAGFYYWILNVNFLQLTDAADFLVMVFQHPLVPVLLLLPFPLFSAYMAVAYRVMWWARWRFRFLGERLPDPAGPPRYGDRVQRLMGYSFFAVYAVAGLEFYALGAATRVQAGKGERITVELRPSARSAAMDFDRREVIFLGTTTHYTIVYDPDERQAWSLPHDSIARLVHPPRRRRAEPAPGPEVAPPVENGSVPAESPGS